MKIKLTSIYVDDQDKALRSGTLADVMSHMMEYMQAGPQSMAMCPMMKTMR